MRNPLADEPLVNATTIWKKKVRATQQKKKIKKSTDSFHGGNVYEKDAVMCTQYMCKVPTSR